MKTTLLVLFFFVADIFGETLSVNDPSAYHINATCLNEYGINPARINNKIDERELTSKEIYCSAACMYRNLGIMRSDGTISLPEVEAQAKDDPSGRQLFYSVYNACEEGKSHCELVRCMFYELKNHLVVQASHANKFGREVFSTKGLIDLIFDEQYRK